LSGNLYAKQRVDYLADLLEQIGLQRERIRMINISAGMGAKFSELANEFCATVKELGPIGLKKHRAKTESQHQENPANDADTAQAATATGQ
jgi:coenzyme F420-reducing hydrogenase delta subunit